MRKRSCPMKTDVNGNIYMEQDEYQEYLAKQEEERVTKAQQMNLAEEQAPLAETSLYELNQSLIAQLPVYDEKKWTAAKLIIADWFKKNLDTYYMMLCKEQSYYTVFDRQDVVNQHGHAGKQFQTLLRKNLLVHSITSSKKGGFSTTPTNLSYQIHLSIVNSFLSKTSIFCIFYNCSIVILYNFPSCKSDFSVINYSHKR